MSIKSQRPTLVGFIIDVSSSMGRNWKIRDGKEAPKIEFIKEALNRQIQKIRDSNSSRAETKEVELFCIGMGFRRPMKQWQVITTKNNKEIQTEKIIQTQIDEAIVCDVLALVEIIPTKSELVEIEQKISTKWLSYSTDVLQKINLRERLFDDFVFQIRETIQTTALERLNNGTRGSLLKVLAGRTVLPDNRWLNLQTQNLQQWKLEREKQIEFTASNHSYSYAQHLRQMAERIFMDSAPEYEKYIRAALDKFVSQQCSRMLELLTLGHPAMLVFNSFDEEKLFGLAEQIYSYLDTALYSKITRTWLSNGIRLRIVARAAGGRLDTWKGKTLTEELVQKLVWDKLRPFVKTLVINIFRDVLKKKAKEWFYEWINLSSSREVTRSIKDITNIWPDVLEEEIYSGEFMFGATPAYDAIKKVSLRFTDVNYTKHRKVLVVISDGEFEEQTILYAARLLQQIGVTIISIFISNNGKPTEKLGKEWPIGTKMMFEISSTSNMSDSVSRALGSLEYQTEEGKKLFIQVSDSETLEHVLGVLLTNH